MNTVNLKLFVEGYYAGNETMTSVKNNQDQTSPTNEVETVTATLWAGTNPVEKATATLQTDGTASFQFETAGEYVVSVRGGNGLEVFTPSALTVGTTPLNYDFTVSASQAFGSNQVEVESGVFALYSGDCNGDGEINITDLNLVNDAIDASLSGVQVTDLNGDGAVDNSDSTYVVNNQGKSVLRP